MRQVLAYIVLTLTLVASCGDQRVPQTSLFHFGTGKEVVDEEIRPYFESYVNSAKCLGVPLDYVSLTIQFIESDQDYFGLCKRSSTGINVIDIPRSTWQTMSAPNRLKLIYHEMAHCSLGMDHVEDNFNRTHVMAKYFDQVKQYEFVVNFEARVKELFVKANNPGCVLRYQEINDPTLLTQPLNECFNKNSWEPCRGNERFSAYLAPDQSVDRAPSGDMVDGQAE